MPLAPALSLLTQGHDLPAEVMHSAFKALLDTSTANAEKAAFLTALAKKGESAEEIFVAASMLRERMLPFPAPRGLSLDVCGTGGDQSGSLNISTAVAFVVAACGVRVIKHGNRAVTSTSGSSDVLTALGIALDAPESEQLATLARSNLLFLAAPRYHPTLAVVAEVRKSLPFRTIFNLLGPLVNPARVSHQLLGVYDKRWLAPMAEVLQRLGTTAAWVVHGAGGLDELSLAGVSHAQSAGEGKSQEIDPQAYGLALQPLSALRGGDATYNARALIQLLEGEKTAYRDAVLLNAAAALVVAEHVRTLPQGLQMAAEAIDNGAALATLKALLSN
jgi:anthranilate phosphoribosyltransferase